MAVALLRFDGLRKKSSEAAGCPHCAAVRNGTDVF
jgi:hypothetical protein